LKYFKTLGLSTTAFQQIPFNQIQYSDACNFNNVYICAVPRVSLGVSLKYLLPAQKEKIISSLYPVKMLTTEANFMDPVYKAVAFGTNTISSALSMSDRDLCKVEIVKTPGNTRTNQSIIADAAEIIQTAFDNSKQTLGSTLSITDISNKLLAIDGVSQINTTRVDTGEKVTGLSLFLWNPSYSELDKSVVRSDIILQPFEFLYFENLTNVSDKFFVTETTSGNLKY
jgi:hypothetical protein